MPIDGEVNVKIEFLPNGNQFAGTCLICAATQGWYGGGFSNWYSSVGRAVAALKLHFNAAHGDPIVLPEFDKRVVAGEPPEKS